MVGSGPAGAAAIARLAEAGVPVTLLEAGRKRAALGLTVRVAGLTVARIHRELKSRSEGLVVNGVPEPVLFEDVAPGGLSNHWSCAVPRFSRQDFLDARLSGFCRFDRHHVSPPFFAHQLALVILNNRGGNTGQKSHD